MPSKKNGKTPDKKADKKAAAKPAAKAASKAAAKPAPTSQSEKMRALYEKLHGASAEHSSGPGQNIPGKKGGFDPHQFHAQGKGARHNTMMRRTQSRGGGSGGGGGGGGGGGSSA
jgi:hypothetical protein